MRRTIIRNKPIYYAIYFVFFVMVYFIFPSIGTAVPAPDILGEFQQPDGTKFYAKLKGDEWFNWHETEGGFTIVKDEKDGWWKFGELNAEGILVPGKYRAGKEIPQDVGISTKILPDKETIRKIKLMKYEGKGITEDSIQSKSEPIMGIPGPKEVSPKGAVKNLVILCKFSDHGTGKYFPALAYDSLFNTIGYNFDGAVGSVKDYYIESSYGQFTLNSYIANSAWITLPRTEAFYGGDASSSNKDTSVRQMITDALDSVDSYINFSDYDNDGDGYVDCITFIHSGHGQEYTGNPSNCIWSKKWSLSSPWVSSEGIRVSNFHTEPALRGLSTTTAMGRIGVVCHEMGHFFGLPDLYDTDGGGEGIGAWGLMGSGSWGADGGSYPQRPTHFTGWCKTQLDWLKPTVLHSKISHNIVAVETTKSIVKISEGLPISQYFLVENRQKIGFDSQLLGGGIGGGLCIWHIDEGRKDNNTDNYYMVAMEEADGDLSLQVSTRAESGDIYPGSSNNSTFNTTSNPSTHSNPIGAGTTSYIGIYQISTSKTTMSFKLDTLVPTLDNPADPPNDCVTLSWSSAVNSARYMLLQGIDTSLSSYSDGAENDTTFREDWAKLGDFRRTNQNASSGSYSYLARFCDDPASSGGWSIWNSDYQGITMNQLIYITPTTYITFQTRYYLYSTSEPWARAYLQIKRITDSSWSNLSTFSGGPHSSWQSVTISSTRFSSYSGNSCTLRFVVVNLAGSVWSYYTTSSYWPWNGFAFDEFQLLNAGIPSYSWSTINSNIYSTSTTLTGLPVDNLYFKVQSYDGSAWRGWSNIEDAIVTVPVELSIFEMEAVEEKSRF